MAGVVAQEAADQLRVRRVLAAMAVSDVEVVALSYEPGAGVWGKPRGKNRRSSLRDLVLREPLEEAVEQARPLELAGSDVANATR